MRGARCKRDNQGEEDSTDDCDDDEATNDSSKRPRIECAVCEDSTDECEDGADDACAHMK
jgi:hypothetical protein